jgi:uncharacterized protein
MVGLNTNIETGKHMELSKYNIIDKIKNSDSYFIVNLLSGNADILEPDVGEAFLRGEITDRDSFIEKGYLADPKEEDLLFKQKYLEFIDRRESDEIQIFFVPWYACNFDCTYCYQSSYENNRSLITTDVVDAFFENIQKQFADRRFYITLFGGEPLLKGSHQKRIIDYFLKVASDKNISVAIVTNGYNLVDYVPLLAKSSIREVQVTLDGPREIHNKRRPLKNNETGTFDQIVMGIDAALAANLRINFRVVLDKNNIDYLPELAAFAKEQGWTSNPLFKTQFGRNYELHHCSASPDILFSRIALYEKIYELTKTNPVILDFHKPAYSISRFLSENGELPDPLFDACPGCKTEWALDYTGGIYSCTATVGKQDERLGTFYPTVQLDDELVAQWRNRDVTTINKCNSCSNRLACGGGCASVAKNETGSLLSPDCRPIKELLSLGISTYFVNEAANV